MSTTATETSQPACRRRPETSPPKYTVTLIDQTANKHTAMYSTCQCLYTQHNHHAYSISTSTLCQNIFMHTKYQIAYQYVNLRTIYQPTFNTSACIQRISLHSTATLKYLTKVCPLKCLSSIETYQHAIKAHSWSIRKEKNKSCKYSRMFAYGRQGQIIHLGTAPMTYERKVACEAVNLANECYWRPLLVLTFFGEKMTYNWKSAYGLRYT